MKKDNIYDKYREFLKKIDTDENVFLNFKSDSSFNDILEHVDFDFGNKYNKEIINEFKVKVSDYIDIIKANDAIGNPVKYNFDVIEMSPSNLRYIYHSLLIKSKCDKWFNKKNIKIIEIGGGYGGLCLFIKKIFNEYDIDYTIIDLPEPGVLQNKYISALGLTNCRIVSAFDMDSISSEKFDLVISNYCLSEISLENQKEYFDKIIKNCDKKFFIWNYLTREKVFGIFKTLRISSINKNDYLFEDERPSVSNVIKFIYSK